MMAPMKRTVTANEQRLLEGLVAGHTNGELARKLGTTDGYIAKRVNRLCRQCGVDNRTELAVVALWRGWVTLETAWRDLAPRIIGHTVWEVEDYGRTRLV